MSLLYRTVPHWNLSCNKRKKYSWTCCIKVVTLPLSLHAGCHISSLPLQKKVSTIILSLEQSRRIMFNVTLFDSYTLSKQFSAAFVLQSRKRNVSSNNSAVSNAASVCSSTRQYKFSFMIHSKLLPLIFWKWGVFIKTLRNEHTFSCLFKSDSSCTYQVWMYL